MYATETNFRRGCGDRDEQALARLAYIARGDIYMGGTNALMLARRAERMGLPLSRDMDCVVSEVYTSSNGTPAEDYTCHECDECGSVHYGREAAIDCCVNDVDDLEDVDEVMDEFGV